MHELSIATEIINIVEKEASRQNLTRVEEIGLKIGALTGVNPDALTFAFEASTGDTSLAGVVIKIEKIPVKGECRACGNAFEVQEFVFICPECGSSDLKINQGEELDIDYIAGL